MQPYAGVGAFNETQAAGNDTGSARNDTQPADNSPIADHLGRHWPWLLLLFILLGLLVLLIAAIWILIWASDGAGPGAMEDGPVDHGALEAGPVADQPGGLEDGPVDHGALEAEQPGAMEAGPVAEQPGALEAGPVAAEPGALEAGSVESPSQSPAGPDSTPTCIICLDQDTSDNAGQTTLPCSHTFHTHCIAQWVDLDSRCPICRGGVRPVDDLVV